MSYEQGFNAALNMQALVKLFIYLENTLNLYSIRYFLIFR
jgi:hypothetical protein